jgi:hypothetical protein
MQMTCRHFLLAIALILALAGCAQPVPAEKSDYVGEWKAPGMTLLIMQDGSIHYERIQGGSKTKVTGPIQKYEGNDFSVGIGFLSTTFVVSKPPYQVSGVWKMVVDGVELTKIDGSGVSIKWNA